MKTLRIPLTILCVLAMSVLSANAAQLATAKVLGVTGTVSKHAPNGSKSQLKAGDILNEGDSVSAAALSSVKLVFSNGSELTIEENTSLKITKLEQASFSGNQSYEQLQADPSKSQTLLELNYGELRGHVKKLSFGSNFAVKTPLGTAAIRGTFFSIALRFDSQTNNFVLSVTNLDGSVDVISTFSGDIIFGGDGNEFEGNNERESSVELPQQQTIKIKLSKDNPNREAILAIVRAMLPAELIVEFNNEASDTDSGENEIPAPEITPEDPGLIIISEETGV